MQPTKVSTNSTHYTGLGETEAKNLLKRFGPNQLTAKSRISALAVYFSQFQNNLILILIAAAVMILFVWYFGRQQSDLIEAILILSIVLLITLLGFIQEWKAEKAIESLKKLLALKATVIREGKEKIIDAAQLVPGDVVVLETGQKVSADIRLVDVANLQTNEAPLTGESTPVDKTTKKLPEGLPVADRRNMVFSGTTVVQGRGLGTVTATGDRTELGKIATSVAEIKEEPTPIQKRLDRIGRLLSYIVLAIAGVVFIFIVLFASAYAHLGLLERVIQSFVAAVALAVAAIPEGLPAVVTISLALGTQRMLKRSALVRKLNSVETLGSTDVICADKTGTLTSGEMTVRQITGQTDQVLTAGLVCNNAKLQPDGEAIGDPTEVALLKSAKRADITFSGRRIKEIPFSPERKMMSVLVQEHTGYRVYTKGAPETVLSRCSTMVVDGKEISLSPAQKQNILDQTSAMSQKALRTLGFASKKSERNSHDLEHNLIFLGLQGMIDPPRPETKPLIDTCHRAGLRVIMVTGDHAATAAAVAREIGIGGRVLTGAEVDEMSDVKLAQVVQKVDVYARVNPAFKMRIIDALKRDNHVVAMTGDGVNDAPALKYADIGIAMGKTGTDVAKEASDVVLLDDSFKTIVAAIEEGRGIFNNIRKFVNYLISCNIGEVLVVFLGTLLLQDLLLTATMLLWINIVTDGLPALALAMDPADRDILREEPSRFQGEIIERPQWFEMVSFGLAITVATIAIYWLNLPEGLREARGAAFVAIVLFELVRLFHIRSRYHTPLLSNRWLVAAVLLSILLQIVVVMVPALSNLFEVSAIDAADWVYIAAASGLIWFIVRIIPIGSHDARPS